MDEYIKRNDAIHCVESQYVDGKMWGNENTEGTLIEAYTVIDELSDIPAADVAPVMHGRWVKIYENGEPAVKQHQIGVFCSKCMKMPKDKFTESDFCPNCGEKMDEEETRKK